MNTFASMPLMSEIQAALSALGFTKPTEIQEKVIPFLLNNPQSDIHAQAQTGTGKTLAFGIPLLQAINPSIKATQGLVIAPTRELVLQTYESLKDISRQTSIRLEPIYGGMPINRQIDNIRRGAQIIIGTPGRLNDHLRRKTLSLKNLKILVLDEADIMLDMGFKEDIDFILNHAPLDRRIWLFSATVMSGIKQLIKSHMSNVAVVKASEKGVVSSQVKQYFCIVPTRKRVEASARFIEAAPDFYGIIFCQTKTLTSEVTEQLASRGFKVDCLHGDMKQSVRNRVIKGFRNKDFNILVATNVAARGIDVSDLTHVINFAIPEEHESYIHRIGRTGRAGKEGIAIVFVAPHDMYRVKRLEKNAQTSLQEITIPPVAAIINAKMGAVSDFIEQAKQPNRKLTPVHVALQELIKSFTEQEMRSALLVALEEKFFKDMVHEDLKQVSTPIVHVPQEICMELGRSAGLGEDAMREYLYRTCNLLPQEVRKVRVLDHRTFISVPENRLHACVKAMHASPVVDQPHKIYVVKDYDQRSHAGQRKERRFNRERRRSKRGRF